MEHQINGVLFEDIEAHKDEIYVFQHELESMVPQHVHTQGHILVVLSGVATMNVEHSAYYIPYGDFVWIPSENHSDILPCNGICFCHQMR